MFSLQDEDIQNFLQEATLMDPRFKGRLVGAVADAWDRLEKAAVGSATEQVFNAHPCFPCVPCYNFYDEV